MSSLAAQRRLNDHLMAWDAEIRDYGDAQRAASTARSKAEERISIVKLTAVAQNEKISEAKLDREADTDADVIQLRLNYRIAEGIVETHKSRLQWFKAKGEALRSEVSTEREERGLYADKTGHA